jgi:hypothetical protein
VEAYPNPTTGMLNVKFSCDGGDATYLLSITDVTGRRLLSKEVKGHEGINQTELDMSDFTKGIYFLSMRSLCMNKLSRIAKQ